jgi:hypothetical protein
MGVGMFERRFARPLGNVFKSEQVDHRRQRFLQVAAFHVRRRQSDGFYHEFPSEIQAFESNGEPLNARRNS